MIRTCIALTTSSVSDAPSYHSNPPYQEPVPPYAPRENQTTSGAATRNNRGVDRDRPVAQQQTIGLPPVPPAPPIGVPNLHNFRIPTWSTRNAPAARQLHSVIERRVNAGMGTGGPGSSSSSNSSTGFMPRRYQGTPDRPAPEQSSSSSDQSEEHILRPLEDPYLVGERAAEAAKRERLARERGDDILQREDKQWDWLLGALSTGHLFCRLDADASNRADEILGGARKELR